MDYCFFFIVQCNHETGRVGASRLACFSRHHCNTFTFRVYKSRGFFSKATYSNYYLHSYLLTLAAVIQGANQHIRISLRFSILPKDTSTCRIGEMTQQLSDNPCVTTAHHNMWTSSTLLFLHTLLIILNHLLKV